MIETIKLNFENDNVHSKIEIIYKNEQQFSPDLNDILKDMIFFTYSVDILITNNYFELKLNDIYKIKKTENKILFYSKDNIDDDILLCELKGSFCMYF